MQAKIVPGYEGGISTGQRQRWTLYGSGPKSYVQAATTGDPILVPSGMYLDYVGPAFDTTHTYFVTPYPSVVGSTRATWAFKWWTAAGMTEVSASTDLSAVNVQFEATGGEF